MAGSGPPTTYGLGTRGPRATDTPRVVIPAEVGATLRDLRLVDSETERLVFRARASEEGVVLVGDDDDLDHLLGFVAAEANHEDDRRRQRRLDDAYDILSLAIEAVQSQR